MADGRHFENSRNRSISAMVRLIVPKYRRTMHVHHINQFDRWKFRIFGPHRSNT